MHIIIKNRPDEVIPYLDDVRAGADTAKEELGFLPKGAYEEFAVSGKLLVATASMGGAGSYAGHLLFGGIYPHAKVFQLFVMPAFRRRGIAGKLINALKTRLTSGQWLSIRANVADDLAANAVWAQMGFQTVRTKTGGAARRRRINVRVLELETPSLLDLLRVPARPAGLRLAERYPHRPIYLIDLNVLFDTVRNRARSASAAKVVWAGMSNSIRLMVAAEFTSELRRTSNDPKNDPILAFAAQADCLSRPPEKTVRSLIAKLAPAIFPERFQQRILSDRDRSDLTHIATAIHHGAAGFITSEKAILRAREHLRDAWKLDVVGVEELARMVDPGGRTPRTSVAEWSTGTINTRRSHDTDIALARSLLERIHTAPGFIQDALACQGTNAQWALIADGEGPLGFAKWDVHGGLRRTADVFLCVDERSPAADAILDHLLDIIPRELSAVGPALIRLAIPSGQIATRQAALSAGFLPPDGAGRDHPQLQRLAVGRIVFPDNWMAVRQALMSAASVSLPARMPTCQEASRHVLLNSGDQNISMSMADIESALAPVLFLFPGRAGIIVPIREHFARDLIGAGPQLSILAPPQAILRRERVYISAPGNLRRLAPGTPMLFYESQKGKGRGCIIAVARITDSRVVNKADVLDNVEKRGVLNGRTLETRSVTLEVTETSFDNIFVFESPVPLKRLRELGCVDGSNLISPRSISHERLVQVIREGRSDG